MQAPVASLKRIEAAMDRASSPLVRALKMLGESNHDRGTCLVLEHEEFGEVLIADRFWRRDRAETLKDSVRLAVVDLSQEGAFRRIAVLVDPTGDEGVLDDGALALALAALDVAAALAGLGLPVDEGADKLQPSVRAQELPPAMPAEPPVRAMKDEGVWGI